MLHFLSCVGVFLGLETSTLWYICIENIIELEVCFILRTFCAYASKTVLAAQLILYLLHCKETVTKIYVLYYIDLHASCPDSK